MSLVKFLSAFVFPSSRRHAFRERANVRKLRRDNVVEVADADFARLRLRVKGTGNRIVVGKMAPVKGVLTISVFGSGCVVEIGQGLNLEKSLRITIVQDHPDFGPVKDVRVSIGEYVGFNGKASVTTYNSHARVEVGDRCMFGADATLMQTDGHPICDLATDRVVNLVTTLHVGSHVWSGSRVTYLKNAFVADDCVVGLGSVVAGKFAEPHSVIAGNPAVSRRVGVTWKYGDPAFVANEQESS